MAVGTGQGQVYKSTEGFGKAAILPPASPDLYNQTKDFADAIKQRKQQQPLDKQAILKGFRDKQPEWWFTHNEDLDNEFNTLLDYGAELLGANVDPTKSTDQASADWQKRWAKLANDASQSIQLKKDFEATQAIINKNPDKFTTESMDKRLAYYKKPLSEIQESGELPPRLVDRQAPFKYVDYLQKLTKSFSQTNPEYTDEDVASQADLVMSDPSANEYIQDVVQTRYDNMPKGEQSAIQTMALNKGMQPLKYMVYQDIDSQLSKEDIDVIKWVKDSMPQPDITGTSYEDRTGITRGKKTEQVTPEKAENTAKAMLQTKPRALEQLVRDGLATDQPSAIKYLKETILNQAKTRKESFTRRKSGAGYLGFGRSEEEVKKDYDVWEDALRGNLDFLEGLGNLSEEDKIVARKATAAYLAGIELDDGRTIVDVAQGVRSGEQAAARTILGRPIFDWKDKDSYVLMTQSKGPKRSYTNSQGQDIAQQDKTYEPVSYSLVGEGQKNFLQTAKTQELYDKAYAARKGDLFIEPLKREIELAREERARAAKPNATKIFEKFQDQKATSVESGNQEETDEDAGEFDDF